ncbi:F-box and leucine-rich repeat protein 6 [Haematobia irritans]|uniref:F-box and leucine-rich repeat protein 6 n=1 Tax=Haematobia irritans TaxID=7368 RepID=UPI003F4FE886
MDASDKEESNNMEKNSRKISGDSGEEDEEGGSGGLGTIDGLAKNSSNSSIKTHFKQVPVPDTENDADTAQDNDDYDMHDDMDNNGRDDSENAGIHKGENTVKLSVLSKIKGLTNALAGETKTTNLVQDDNPCSNIEKSTLTLTPSTTEDPSQSPSSIVESGGCDTADGKATMQSPVLTSPAASTPDSTPPSTTAGYSPPVENSSPTGGISETSPPSMQIKKQKSSPTQLQPPPPPPVQQAINVVRNGTIPNAGKPLMSTISKKLEKSAKSSRSRKSKSTGVAMYESEISQNKIGIKLCIKKSDSSLSVATAAAIAAVSKGLNKAATSTGRSRKSSRNSKQRIKLTESNDEADEYDYEPKRKKERSSKRQSSTTTSSATSANVGDENQRPIVDQSIWGRELPEPVLLKIFQKVIEKEGCLPTLFRLGRVCSLWRQVSLTPTLWRTMDLTTWIKEKYRTELKLKWFVDNRCTCCTELNVSNFKVTDINCFLVKLVAGAPNLTSITLSGWKGFTCDHLAYLVDNMKKLERIDLSSVNVEMNASKSAVGAQSLCNSMQVMGDKLTHLYLAHNRLAGIPQLVNVLSTHCPNLVLLDLSNVTTQATSHGILHVEKLQQGCPKLKVLRITNSHITLSTASMQEMMDSPGFPELEELSVAVMDESRVIGDEHIQRILKSSSKLKLLDVRGCARLTHESLIRLPAWDIKHLFLSGCSVTRDMGSGLELIASKWAHSLIELDLAWANVQQPLDNALRALADKGAESRLAHLNLCGSSVSEEAVKEILANCPLMSTINLASCRGLPRGVKRQMQGPQELNELRDVLKVQLKVKLPDNIAPTSISDSASSSTASATAASSKTTKCANSNDGGGGSGHGASSP